MKFIEEADVLNKKVILRLDLNVTIENNKIVDDTRIKKSIPTIKYLLNNGAHVLIMSHLGKVKNEEDKKNNSLKIVCERLSELLAEEILFIDDNTCDILKTCLDSNKIVMLENTRFQDVPYNKESGCNDDLSKFWASLGDVFVNDAFGTTHRCHASNYGISKYLPTYYGFLIKEELVGLSPVIDNISRPFTVIMGGAKVDDKIKLIESLLENADILIVGGGIANTFLKAFGYNIGSSLYSVDYVDKLFELIQKYKSKIWMPVDVIVKRNLENVLINIDEVLMDDVIYDIGTKTIDIYSNIISGSKTLLINGTVGLYEKEEFRNGTEKIFQAISKTDAICVAGGGDAITSINKLGYSSSFDFMSTGGGATLDYLANKKLKCFGDE